MINLCQPYGAEITCLCEEQGATVLRCFLTEQTEGGGRLAAPSPPAACNRPGDPSTELILAGAIALLVLLLACWRVVARRPERRHCCKGCCQASASQPLSLHTDTRSVQTDGPPVYPCLPAAPLSRSVESYLSDIPPIQEAQAWPSLLYVEWILQ